MSPPPPPKKRRFPRKFSPHPRIRNHRTVLRVKTENLPPDRVFWYFLRKKIIGGYNLLGKLPPGGYKFRRKPPPRGGGGGGGGAELPGGGVFFLGNIPPGGGQIFIGNIPPGGGIFQGEKISWYTGPNLAPPP